MSRLLPSKVVAKACVVTTAARGMEVSMLIKKVNTAKRQYTAGRCNLPETLPEAVAFRDDGDGAETACADDVSTPSAASPNSPAPEALQGRTHASTAAARGSPQKNRMLASDGPCSIGAQSGQANVSR